MVLLTITVGCGSKEGVIVTNDPPRIVIAEQINIEEGSVVVAPIQVVDEGSATVIIQGADAALFGIVDDALVFIEPSVFIPGGQNSYSIVLVATDPEGETAEVGVSVSVLNLLQGRVVDAPLSEAIVFLDLNNNMIRDESEPSALSDAQGYFVMPDTAQACDAFSGLCDVRLVVVGGTDVVSGVTLSDSLLVGLPSVVGSSNVTPLSTILSLGNDITIASLIGINQTFEEFLLTDYWQGATVNREAESVRIQHINAQLALVIQTAVALGAMPKDVITRISQAIENIASSDSPVFDLTNSATVTTLLSASAPGQPSASAGAIGAVIAGVNAIIADLDDLESVQVASLTLDAQTTLKDEALLLAQGAVTLDQFVDRNSPTQLIARISNGVEFDDTDLDSVPNLVDTDDDNDGVLDVADAFPLNALESLDTDGDGTGDNADTDDDGDGIEDVNDAFPIDDQKPENLFWSEGVWNEDVWL